WEVEAAARPKQTATIATNHLKLYAWSDVVPAPWPCGKTGPCTCQRPPGDVENEALSEPIVAREDVKTPRELDVELRSRPEGCQMEAPQHGTKPFRRSNLPIEDHSYLPSSSSCQ